MSTEHQNITDDDGKSVGWFNRDTVRKFEDDDYREWRYQHLYLTTSNRYVLGRISCVQGESDSYRLLSQPLSHEGLLKQDYTPSDLPAGTAQSNYVEYLKSTEL